MYQKLFEDDHVAAAKEALKSKNGLVNVWEMNFLQSMVFIQWPTDRQLTTLEVIVAKSKRPPPGRRRRRGAPR